MSRTPQLTQFFTFEVLDLSLYKSKLIEAIESEEAKQGYFKTFMNWIKSSLGYLGHEKLLDYDTLISEPNSSDTNYQKVLTELRNQQKWASSIWKVTFDLIDKFNRHRSLFQTDIKESF